MNKKILITGGTGFVGGRLVKRLVEEGCQVRVLVRDPSRLDRSVIDRLEVVQGQLGDAQVAARAVAGRDTILHLAALAKAFHRDPDRYFQVNTQGLAVLLQAAAPGLGQRFVHVSTVAATEPAGRLDVPGLSGAPTPYARSKMASEVLIRRYVNQGGDAVIVRPTRVYGPGPWNDANGTTRLAAMYLKGTFRFRLQDKGARANYVHVDDVVDGIIRAAEHGKSGAAYMLGGQDATLEQYLDMIARQTGSQRKVWAVPPLLMLPVAHLCKAWGRVGGNPSLTPGWLNNFLEDRPVDCRSAVRELGYHPRRLRQGLAETLAWLLTDSKGDDHGGSDSEYRIRGRVHVRPRKNWA